MGFWDLVDRLLRRGPPGPAPSLFHGSKRVHGDTHPWSTPNLSEAQQWSHRITSVTLRAPYERRALASLHSFEGLQSIILVGGEGSARLKNLDAEIPRGVSVLLRDYTLSERPRFLAEVDDTRVSASQSPKPGSGRYATDARVPLPWAK